MANLTTQTLANALAQEIFLRAGDMAQVSAANMYGFVTGALKIEGSQPAVGRFYTDSYKHDLIHGFNGIVRTREIKDNDFSDKALTVAETIKPSEIVDEIKPEADTGLLTAAVSVGGMEMVREVVGKLGKEDRDVEKNIVDTIMDDQSIKPWYKAGILYEIYGHEPWNNLKIAAATNKQFVGKLFTTGE